MLAANLAQCLPEQDGFLIGDRHRLIGPPLLGRELDLKTAGSVCADHSEVAGAHDDSSNRGAWTLEDR